MASTARPCHPGLGAARALAAGRAAPGLAGRVSCVSAHGQPASQHTASQPAPAPAPARPAPARPVCVPCVSPGHYGTHGTHLRLCVSCGHVCHDFQIEVARQTWKSYTIHTVIIYSIYITIKSSKYMAHMVHTRGFSEGKIRGTPSPTTPHTPTHTH